MKASIRVEGLNETLRAFKAYGRDASKELRQAAGQIADQVVPALVLAGNAASPQAALVTPSIKRRSDRVPVIVAGGSRRARPATGKGGKKVFAGDILFGAEFGGGRRPTTRQFPPWTGRRGYWFWPTLRQHLPRMRREYIRTLDRLAEKWARGGEETGG